MNGIIGSPVFGPIRDYLFDHAKHECRIFLFVPYIQRAALEKLLDGIKSKISIVTSWRLADLLYSSSDLSVYPYCLGRGITLYINNRIHLKVYSVDLHHLILATANISDTGLGLVPEVQWECATFIQHLSSQDRLYFERILQNSLHVNQSMYCKLLEWYEAQNKVTKTIEKFEQIISRADHNDFLISSLPMTRDIRTLEQAYQRISRGLAPSDDEEICDCVYHDLANYQIDINLGIEEFRPKLSKSFFSHPFIRKIEESISPETYFGRIKEWIQKNCTDVPVPSRRDLTGNVQVLLEWFQSLGNGRYVVDIPGSHSQRIRRVA